MATGQTYGPGGMGLAGIASLNQPNKETYIYETHNFNSPTNVINRELQRSNDVQKAYEGTGITPQTFPNWVTQNPNASEMMNQWQMPGGGSWVGSPMWMDAGITNRNLGGDETTNDPLMQIAKGVIYNDPRIEEALQKLQKEKGYISIGIGSQNLGVTQTRDERDLELRRDTLSDQGQQLYDLYMKENPSADPEKVMEFLQKKYTDEENKRKTEEFWGVTII